MVKLLSTEELSQLVGVHCQTILRWAKDGVIPAIRINARTIRFSVDEVMNALSQLPSDVVRPQNEGSVGNPSPLDKEAKIGV